MSSIKVALNSMKRNPAMTLASIILVFLTVLIVGVVGLITSNTAYASKGAVNNLTIYVRANNDATPEQIEALKTDIEKTVQVDAIQLETKTEALDRFANELSPENPQAMLELFSGDNNPLSDEYKVRLVDGSKLKEAGDLLKQLPNVKDVGVGDSEATQRFIDFMHRITLFSLIFAVIMAIISVFIIVNTIKLTITSRYKEIEIMRLVGATKSYVRKPFIWEGIIFGLIGGILAFVILLMGYNVTLNFLTGSYGSTDTLFIPFAQIILPLLLIVVVFGVFIGAVGSMISTKKYLNK